MRELSTKHWYTMRCHGCELYTPRFLARSLAYKLGMKRLIIRNGAQFKFHQPRVFAWSFVLRLEHLAVQITSTIKHSSRFQQEGAIEWFLEWMRLISNISAMHYNNTWITLHCNKKSQFSLKKPRKARKFVEVRLCYFCTILYF